MAKNPARPNVQKSTQKGKLNPSQFRGAVWAFYKENGRHDLPWRKTNDPYKIMVSEVMLQQTQVLRVLDKYKEFLKAFPTIQVLARSNLAEVLKVWSGLGYNRRGKFLRDAAVAIVENHGGKVPHDAATLRSIPGIGPYTASAILIFAFNIPDTLIETNVRSVFIHHFFTTPVNLPIGEFTGEKNKQSRDTDAVRVLASGKKISDRELLPLISAAAEGQDPREWHWALMDYGSYLKKAHPNPSRASAHHVKQSKFEGSLRQVRGAILRELQDGPSSLKNLRFGLVQIEMALTSMAKDGIVKKVGSKWQII